MSQLERLQLGHNRIASIYPSCSPIADLDQDSPKPVEDWNPENHLSLRYLDLQSNDLSDTEELGVLEPLPLLRDLLLAENSLTEGPFPEGELTSSETGTQDPSIASTTANYRLYLAFILPRLTVLDGLPVSPEEKIGALNKYNPHPKVVSAVKHAQAMQRQVRLYAKIKAKDSVKDNRPIVLCGPNGVGKRFVNFQWI